MLAVCQAPLPLFKQSPVSYASFPHGPLGLRFLGRPTNWPPGCRNLYSFANYGRVCRWTALSCMKFIHRFRQNIAKNFYRSPIVARIAANQFHRSFYYRRKTTWENTAWLGAPLLKCPLDLWVYQEILHDLKPEFVIECGTKWGGSSYFMAGIFDLIGKGRIITIDIEDLKEGHPTHERVDYLIGSSTSPGIAERVKSIVGDAGPVMVILDSDHSHIHVLDELLIYSEMVTLGSYIIVEDTNVGGHPVRPAFGPGPMKAVHDFLKTTDAFEFDRSRTKYMLTFNPNGYLKRLS